MATPKVVECGHCQGTIWFDWGAKPGEPGRSIKTSKLIPLQAAVDEQGKPEFKQERHNCPAYVGSGGTATTAVQATNGSKEHLITESHMQQIPQQQQQHIPISGPRADDWETRLGLLNGQIFMRLDKIIERLDSIVSSLSVLKELYR